MTGNRLDGASNSRIDASGIHPPQQGALHLHHCYVEVIS